MLHTLECDEPWFSKLKNGLKKVEGRKASTKYRQIQAGDEILFRCGSHEFLSKVVKIDSFKSLDDYLLGVTIKEALPGIKTIEEAREIYYQWSTQEEIAENGFLGIWIELR